MHTAVARSSNGQAQAPLHPLEPALGSDSFVSVEFSGLPAVTYSALAQVQRSQGSASQHGWNVNGTQGHHRRLRSERTEVPKRTGIGHNLDAAPDLNLVRLYLPLYSLLVDQRRTLR
jgi:hypothetical protein